MANEDNYRRYANIPIPSYEEATTRPSSSQTHRGPQEVSADAERQGLLGQTTPQSTYHPPTAESDRSSIDSDLQLPEVTGVDDEEDRRHIEELDYLDPSAPDASSRQPGLYHRARLRSKLAQRLSNLGATLSSIRLPSFRSFYTPVSTGTSADTAAEAQTPPPSRAAWLARVVERLPSIPPQYRISMPNAARLFGLLTLILLVYFLLIVDVFPGRNRTLARQLDPEAVRAFVSASISPHRIQEYLMHITQYDHVAGTQGDFYMAEWMRERWVEEGGFDDTALLSYFAYLNYPNADGRSVSIVSPEEKKWDAVLEEDMIDPQKQQSLAWHAYSKSGEAEGHLVYVNGGSKMDFALLQSQGVELQGSIALIRRYGDQLDPASKIKEAEQAGCAGVLIYSDPRDDGAARGAVWPDGPWRPEDSLHRDSVVMTSWTIGDPLTPGWASKKDSKTMDRTAMPALPNIPSLPLSWRDAQVLLAAIQGHGVRVPEDWVGGTEAFSKEWYSGNTTSADGAAPVVHLRNFNDESNKQQIWNVHGLIEGIESPEKKIIIANHHDAWCFGSVSPGSGTAIMMELVNIFGQLRQHGWVPLRTIEFISWDAKEFNMVGSTEYVEHNLDYLRANGMAYINVDSGLYGPGATLRAAGSPVWQDPLLHVLDRVGDPATNSTLRQVWDERRSELHGLDAEGDYVAFQDMAGTSSIDFGFEGAPYGYPSGSCYETFDWMATFGDPAFQYSRTLAQVWALLILEIADRPVLPFNVNTYAEKIQGPYLDNLQNYADAQFDKLNQDQRRDLQSTGFSVEPLRAAAANLTVRAYDFHHFEDTWTANVLGNGGYESTKLFAHRLQYNHAISRFETHLLDLPLSSNDEDEHGVPERPQFKHVIFGPQTTSGLQPEYFPFIRAALDRGDWERAQKMVEKTANIISQATQELVWE